MYSKLFAKIYAKNIYFSGLKLLNEIENWYTLIIFTFLFVDFKSFLEAYFHTNRFPLMCFTCRVGFYLETRPL